MNTRTPTNKAPGQAPPRPKSKRATAGQQLADETLEDLPPIMRTPLGWADTSPEERARAVLRRSAERIAGAAHTVVAIAGTLGGSDRGAMLLFVAGALHDEAHLIQRAYDAITGPMD